MRCHLRNFVELVGLRQRRAAPEGELAQRGLVYEAVARLRLRFRALLRWRLRLFRLLLRRRRPQPRITESTSNVSNFQTNRVSSWSSYVTHVSQKHSNRSGVMHFYVHNTHLTKRANV